MNTSPHRGSFSIAPLLCVLAIILAATVHGGEIPQLNQIDLIQTMGGSTVYRIFEGEASIGGNFVKRVEIGKRTAIITYYNKFNAALKPNYTFKVYNGYGLQLATFQDKWVLDTVASGDNHKEEKQISPYPLNEIFLCSGIKVPWDWDKAMYLIIEDMRP